MSLFSVLPEILVGCHQVVVIVPGMITEGRNYSLVYHYCSRLVNSNNNKYSRFTFIHPALFSVFYRYYVIESSEQSDMVVFCFVFHHYPCKLTCSRSHN